MEAAFFDLDKTIISRSSSLALSRPMYRAGMVTRGQLVRSAYAQLVYALVGADERKMDRLKEGMLRLTKGWDRAEVERLVHEVLVEVIEAFVYQEALDLMAMHRSEGRAVFVVSSSPEEIVRPLARHFGVTDVLATRARIVDGRYTGELEFYCYGEAKAEAIRELAEHHGIDLGASYAYSDSSTDLPMLRVVGHPVAVNPDRELRKEAEAAGVGRSRLPPARSPSDPDREDGRTSAHAGHRRGHRRRRGRRDPRMARRPFAARRSTDFAGIDRGLGVTPSGSRGSGRAAYDGSSPSGDREGSRNPRASCRGRQLGARWLRPPDLRALCRQRMLAAPFAHV